MAEEQCLSGFFSGPRLHNDSAGLSIPVHRSSDLTTRISTCSTLRSPP